MKNYTRCKTCNERVCRRTRELRKARIGSGLCCRCKKPAVPGKTMCQEHLAEMILRNKARLARRKKRRLCMRCGKPGIVKGTTKCAPCLERCRILELTKARELKATVHAHYGGKCSCPSCPETNPAFLSIDHINGGGTKHRKEINRGGGSKFHRWIIQNNFPTDLRLLCFNCNMGRAVHGGICPHEQEVLVSSRN